MQNLRNLNAGRNLIDLESDWNAPVEQGFSRNKVRAKTAGQEKMISGLGELGKALIGDTAANSELGAYLEENGYARLRDYHADKQVSATEKTASYRKWTKAIRNNKIAELPRLNDR